MPTAPSHRFLKRSLALSCLLAFTAVLGGCTAAAVIGTAGVAGTSAVAVDRRTLGTMVEDEAIEWKIRAALDGTGLGNDERHHIGVTSFNRIVLLTGQVPDDGAKRRAAETAGRVQQVRGVQDELVVGTPTTISVRSEDLVITGHAKVAMAATPSLRPPTNVNIKVVTEDRVVFLMGLVTRGQGEAATSAIRRVPGIRQIVRLFEYSGS